MLCLAGDESASNALKQEMLARRAVRIDPGIVVGSSVKGVPRKCTDSRLLVEEDRFLSNPAACGLLFSAGIQQDEGALIVGGSFRGD